MRKVYFTITLLITVLLALPALVSAQAVISIDPATADSPDVGQTLDFNVNITGGENIAGFQFTLTYDETALEFVEVKLGDYLPAGAFAVPAKVDAGSVLYGATAIGTTAAEADGTLATLTFKVAAKKDSAVGFSSAKLSDAIAKEVASTTKEAAIKGDADEGDNGGEKN